VSGNSLIPAATQSDNGRVKWAKSVPLSTVAHTVSDFLARLCSRKDNLLGGPKQKIPNSHVTD
jgi:hypothetical protein